MRQEGTAPTIDFSRPNMQDYVVDTVAGTCALRLRRQGGGCVWLLMGKVARVTFFGFLTAGQTLFRHGMRFDLMSLVMNDNLISSRCD